jgi:2-keto-4-pentenoate hydratase/2-oxohepta-3-ene-1,7-dioic acid hydratase in catechol pathway
MKLRRVHLVEGGSSVAVWHGEQWAPLKPALALYRAQGAPVAPELEAASHDLIAFLGGGEALREEVTAVLNAVQEQGDALGQTFNATPLLPFQPLSFRDFMLWEKHVIAATRGLVKRFLPQLWAAVEAHESGTGDTHPQLRPKKIWYEKPIYYMGNHLSFFPDGATIPWPAYTQALDYELELGVVMAHPLFNATPDEALHAIGGFTVVNDFSARDVQIPEMLDGPFGPVKAKNFANGMGMVVVTADEILPHVENLNGQVRVNGQVWSDGNTAGMQHSPGQMLAYASQGERLWPGELLATGTIPGCCGVEINRWLAPGDTIVLEIERIGTLRNVIGQPGVYDEA